jgi:DNA-directed RNA polymerase omega subunit
MLKPKIEDCLAHVDSKYALAMVVSKRMKELTYRMAGEFVDSHVKELTYALNEIAEGRVVPQGDHSTHPKADKK